jgi:hypothetical protein
MAGMAAPARTVDHDFAGVRCESRSRTASPAICHAAPVQHDEGVARTVPQRQHDLIGPPAVRLARGLVQHASAAQRCVRPDPGASSIQHVGHALLEADLATQRDDLLAQVLDHLHQLEGADVRVRLVQDLLAARRP